jgi:dTDP-4-amino-4,6-dideoxygalactose transaminase
MAQGVHKITEQFEQELCKYTGAPYAVALDNCSNALFLALHYNLYIDEKWWQWKWDGEHISIPKCTYPSVPCEIMHVGLLPQFEEMEGNIVQGAYQLKPTKVWDSALRFTTNMYKPNTLMCLSFTGPYKHLKLGKGGAILTDDKRAYEWFKKARFSGRDECSYHEDNFDKNPVVGWNFYMMPEIAARGLLLIQQFYKNGLPISNPDLALPYPDLSKFEIYKKFPEEL